MRNKITRKIIGLAALVLLLSGAVRADVPVPQRKTAPAPNEEFSGRMVIHVRSGAKEPTLIIKRSALKQLRAAIDEAEGAGAAEEPDANVFNFSRAQTVIGGALFSLAFLTGGVWAFRKPVKFSKIALSLMISAGLGGAMLVSANAPPPEVVSLTSRIFDRSTKAYGHASGSVKIKITDETEGRYDVVFEVPTAEGDRRPN